MMMIEECYLNGSLFGQFVVFDDAIEGEVMGVDT